MTPTEAASSEAILEIQDLRLHFPIKSGLLKKTVGYVKAVDGVSFDVYAGETVGLDGDGDLDVFSCEMEYVRGDASPKFYIWENLDGKGDAWREHVIFDGNLGGHEAVVGDVTGNGAPDIIAKPGQPHPDNALGGRMFILFLENLGSG